MLNNGGAAPRPLQVSQDDYKPLLCECGGRTFSEKVFYTLMEWRIGRPPHGVPQVVRIRGLEMVCEGCGKVAGPPASDPRPA